MLRRISLASLLISAVAFFVVACGDPIDASSEQVASTTSTNATSTTTPATTSPLTTTTSTTSTTSTSTTTTSTIAPPVIQSDVEATYSPASVPAGSLLVHDRWSVYVVDLTGDAIEPQVVLGPLEGLVIAAARMATDGSLVVELMDDVPIGEPTTVHKIVQFAPDGSIIDLIQDAVLFDVAPFGGVEQALVGEVWDGDVGNEANLVAVPLDGRPPVAFGTAYSPEYGVGSIDVVDELAIVTAVFDLTELVAYTDAESSQIVRPSPTDGLAYAEAPFVVYATFSPDGSEVAWIEGPEFYFDADANEDIWQGEWRVRSLDIGTGAEIISWPFDFPNPDPFAQVISGLVHTGDRLVISRGAVEDGLVFELELLVLDRTGEEPELYEIPVFGVADVVR